MKENIDLMPGSVACHPVVLPVKTLCSPLTLKQNAGRVFAEYWENCSWGGPIKSVSNECVCVSTEPAVPMAMILFEFGLLDFGSIRGCFFHVPCFLMECQDSQTCSLCPGLSRPQPKSLCLFHWIRSNCGLSIIICWPLKGVFFIQELPMLFCAVQLWHRNFTKWIQRITTTRLVFCDQCPPVFRSSPIQYLKSICLKQIFTLSNVVFFLNKLASVSI